MDQGYKYQFTKRPHLKQTLRGNYFIKITTDQMNRNTFTSIMENYLSFTSLPNPAIFQPSISSVLSHLILTPIISHQGANNGFLLSLKLVQNINHASPSRNTFPTLGNFPSSWTHAHPQNKFFLTTSTNPFVWTHSLTSSYLPTISSRKCPDPIYTPFWIYFSALNNQNWEISMP